MHKKLLMLAVAVAVLIPGISSAAMVLNEMMYDLEGTDTGREWVEVYNSGTAAVDLTGWKLFESGVNHGLVVKQGSLTVPAGGYLVITDNYTKFLEDWSGYTGALADSAFSLSNEGETIELIAADGTSVSVLTYSKEQGALGDGNSLQKKDSQLIAAGPTPGAVNASAATPGNTEGDDEEVAGSESGGSSSNESASSGFSVSLPSKLVGMAGNPMLIESKVSPKSAAPTAHYFWTFGDGSRARDKVSSEHVYAFPGTYVVNVSVRAGVNSDEARTEVSIVEPDVEVTGVGEGKAISYIELTNNASIDADVSGWQLGVGGKRFVIPRGTVVKSGTSIKLPGAVTGLDPRKKDAVGLYLLTGHLVSQFGPLAAIERREELGKLVAQIEDASAKLALLSPAKPKAVASAVSETAEVRPVITYPVPALQVANAASVIELERSKSLLERLSNLIHEIFN